jgi:DNA repair exonuclease SbcCD ATPase subunit
MQYLDENKTKAYCGSLIEQNFSEGDYQFHGYLLWDVGTRQAIEVPVESSYGHFTLVVNRFTDFDKLNLIVDSRLENKRLRIKWQTLPATRNRENERKVDEFLLKNLSPLSIKHISEFIEEKKITIEEKSDLENITKREVIHKILNDYLTKIGVKKEIIEDVIKLDLEIESRIKLEELTNIQWSILKLNAKNFRSYENLEFDWSDKDGVFQIIGENGVGKSTINQLITYILFGKSLETDFRKKFGDSRFVNNKNNANHCEGTIIIEANNEFYAIKRTTVIKKNTEGEITSASTTTSYYKLNDPNSEISEELNISKLNEIERKTTQDKINEIIGSYENFIRVTLTTSDTLNNVLSSDKAVFIDSLLFDSGLNIFDLRLQEFKNYVKELIVDSRFNNFNINDQKNTIHNLEKEIDISNELQLKNNEKLIQLENDLITLLNQKDLLLSSMHQIDVNLLNTNETEIQNKINSFKNDILKLEELENKINHEIMNLKSSYDIKLLEELQLKKEDHKNLEYEKKTLINKHKFEIEQINSKISLCNGEISLFTKEGTKIKNEIIELKNKLDLPKPTCKTCGQELKSKDNILNLISSLEKEMYLIADNIKLKKTDIENFSKRISDINDIIKNINNDIQKDSILFEETLLKIGILNNDKLEVERREKLLIEISNYPLKKENLLLKINEQENIFKKYQELKTKIEENKSINLKISSFNNEINNIRLLIDQLKNNINSIINKINRFSQYISRHPVQILLVFFSNLDWYKVSRKLKVV